MEGKTPYEAWNGVKPTTKHLKFFCSIYYVYIPESNRTKLERKAELGIFLGYSRLTKGYRIFDLQHRKVVVKKDVAMDETTHRNWEKKCVEPDVHTHKYLIYPPLKLSESSEQENEDETASESSQPDSFVLNTKSLAEIYERCNLAAIEPSIFKEAVKYEHWRNAMKEELRMIEKNKTWSLKPRPTNRHVIGVKWIFRTKLNLDGTVNKYKINWY